MHRTDRAGARGVTTWWPRAAVAAVAAVLVLTGGAAASGVLVADTDEVSSGVERTPPTTARRPTTAAPLPTTTVAPTTAPPPPTTPPTTAPPTVPPAAPETTAAPAPVAPPVVASATATAPVPPPPPPRRPLRLLAAGDSLGFTAAFPAPSRAELPGFVASVQPAAMIGCGVLAVTGHSAVDEAGEGAGAFDCSGQGRAELEGLASRPDWIVFFTGAWEHLAWRTPDGRLLPAGSPELRTTLQFELVRRASLAASFGTRTAFVAWVCPHGVAPTRTGAYAHWYNQILREAAAAVPGAFVVEPTDRVCVGADAGGVPTPEKMAAFRDHHPTDRAWLWKEWIGPMVNGRP